MKKILICLFILMFCVNATSVFALEEDVITTNAVENMADNSKSAILLEPTTMTVLYEKNAHERLPMASMTKMMTLLLVFEAIDNGQIKMTDEVVISPRASSFGGSSMFLQANMKIKVEELIKGIAIASGNDAAVAMAEFIAGSENAFVELMNQRVEKLGLGNTHFMNAHGLDAEDHYSSAYDMAHIGAELIKHPTVLSFTGIYEETLNKPDGTSVWLVNSNKLVRFVEGVDGLKTGFTDKASYCLTATGMRGGIRLISTVMGVSSSDLRTKDTVNLLNYGFNGYKLNSIIAKNTVIDTLVDEKAKNKKIEIIAKENITTLQKTTDPAKKYTYKIKYDKYKLPLKENTKVGTVEIYENDKLIKKTDAINKYEIKKAGIFSVYNYVLKEIFGAGIF